MTTNIKQPIIKRQRACSRRITALSAWKYYSNATKKAILQAKRTFAQRKLSQAKFNSRPWCATAKQLSGFRPTNTQINVPGTENMDGSELANLINARFVSICSSLSALDRSSLPAYLPASGPAPRVTRSQMWREHSCMGESTYSHGLDPTTFQQSWKSLLLSCVCLPVTPWTHPCHRHGSPTVETCTCGGCPCYGARPDPRVREFSSPGWHLRDLINYGQDTMLQLGSIQTLHALSRTFSG